MKTCSLRIAMFNTCVLLYAFLTSAIFFYRNGTSKRTTFSSAHSGRRDALAGKPMHLYSNGSVLRHDDVFAIYLLCTSILMTYYHLITCC